MPTEEPTRPRPSNVIELHGLHHLHEGSTLVLSIAHHDPEDECYWLIGVSDALTIAEFLDVLRICLANGTPSAATELLFYDPATSALADAESPLYFYFAELGDAATVEIVTTAGTARATGTGGVSAAATPEVTPLSIELIEAFLRDSGTPEALCIGGGTDIDIDSINAALTGEDRTQSVLATVRPPVRSIIDRSGIFDFVPLLQALDLTRPLTLDAATLAQCRHLPVHEGIQPAQGDISSSQTDGTAEQGAGDAPRELSDTTPGDAPPGINHPTPGDVACEINHPTLGDVPLGPSGPTPGIDAAWTLILCAATLGPDDLRAEIAEQTMAALGWVNDDGSPLAYHDIILLGEPTTSALAELGVDGEHGTSPVERLELCRAILAAEWVLAESAGEDPHQTQPSIP